MKHRIPILFALLMVGCIGTSKIQTNQSCCQQDIESILNHGALYELLSYLGVQHDGTFASIVKGTQKKWLRQQGKQRNEVNEVHQDKRFELLDYFDDLNMRFQVDCQKQQYDYGIILGGRVSGIRTRLAHAIRLWKEGIRFKQLVFIAGERKLDTKLESKQKLFDSSNNELPFPASWKPKTHVPTTESEMAFMVYDQTVLPAGMDSLPVFFVNCPQSQLPSGRNIFCTQDVINAWLETNPTPGSCLAFSHQPYVGFQHAVLKSMLPENFALETVGSRAKNDSLNAIYLDTLARWLYALSDAHKDCRVCKEL